MRYRGIVFDLDDTLFPESEYVLSGIDAVGAWLGPDRRGEAFAAEAKRLFRAGHRGRIFDEAFAGIGMPAEVGLVPELVAIYRAHRPRIALFPDALEALERLRGKAGLGLITDGYSAVQKAKVAALGIAERFTALVFTDDLGRENWKPSLVPYRAAMARLGCDGAACVYIGDNPTKDFLAPNGLGWLTVMVRRGGGEHSGLSLDRVAPEYRPQRTIGSLHELQRILEGEPQAR